MIALWVFAASYVGTPRPCAHGGARKVIEELIFFASDSDNPDAMKREGIPLPVRQMLMREQGLLDCAMQCVQAPFEARVGATGEVLFTIDDISGNVPQLHRMCKLSQRLGWHILRQHDANRQYAMRFVGHLQEQVG